MKGIMLIALSLLLIIAPAYQAASAEAQAKLDFAAGLEETLGHFLAIELNLNERNAELAVVHATHPISELYDAMKPQLAAADRAFDDRFRTTLTQLKDTASVNATRAQAQTALETARGLVEEARTMVVGDALSADPDFKARLMKTLLETSAAEYGEAVSDGEIVEMAEFQDGSAFVTRSQQIFAEIRSGLDNGTTARMDGLYADLSSAYDARVAPSEVATITNSLLARLGEITDANEDDRLEFAAGLEETLGHFLAIEENLDDRNAELAAVHATHPISELYDAMKPKLAAADRTLDDRFRTTLTNLKTTASVDVARAQAQTALDSARDLVEEARNLVVGEYIGADGDFKLRLMKTLLETSMAEYGEAVSDGEIVEMAEFQDGHSFVVRSQQILNGTLSEIDGMRAGQMAEHYADVFAAYDSRASPSEVEAATMGIIAQIDAITGSKVQLEFAAGLEETLGHFLAIEENLDDRNAELAAVHATHPIAELYDSLKPQLAAADSAFDDRFRTTLTNLKDTASVKATRAQAQTALDSARELVEEARTLVVGDALSGERDFKLRLMKTLLETSIAEYGEAVSDGEIVEMAEFQDGYWFVQRSQQIFNGTRSAVDPMVAEETDARYNKIRMAYDDRAAPSEVDSLTSEVISWIDSITGDTDDDVDYIGSIRTLLMNAKDEYGKGNRDLALSQATKAYLDHFEFLEAPLIEAGERDFMLEVETKMRESLRNAIKNGDPAFRVSSLIDSILNDIDRVEAILAVR